MFGSGVERRSRTNPEREEQADGGLVTAAGRVAARNPGNAECSNLDHNMDKWKMQQEPDEESGRATKF